MKTILTLSSLTTALVLSGCSGTTFSKMPNKSVAQSTTGTQLVNPPATPSPSASATPVPSATPCVPVADVTRLTKILFLVDTSGSNSEWVNSTGDAVCASNAHTGCLSPTDPTKAFRLGSIRNFVTKYGGMQNLEWGFVTFSNEHTKDYITNLSGPSFTSSSSVMQQALDNFSSEVDYADTPYGLALNDATSAISHDGDRSSAANPQYYVILLSDGFPTDLKTPSAAAAQVAKVLNAAPGAVTLSTIFYGSQSAAASQSAMDLLSSMAQAGSGQFANVNDPASGINIENVLPGHACQN